jgi:hypothetical protein
MLPLRNSLETCKQVNVSTDTALECGKMPITGRPKVPGFDTGQFKAAAAQIARPIEEWIVGGKVAGAQQLFDDAAAPKRRLSKRAPQTLRKLKGRRDLPGVRRHERGRSLPGNREVRTTSGPTP